jgi:hypothetical protein
MNLRERFNAWVQGMVDAAVARHLPDRETVIINAISGIDRKDLAWHVDTPDFRQNVAQFVKEGLEDDIDTDEIIRKVVRQIDASEVASYIDTSDVACYLDIDSSEIAERVMDDLDMSSLAEELDYDKLTEALVCKLKEAWTN